MISILLRNPKRRQRDSQQCGDSLYPRGTSGERARERGSFSADEMFVQCRLGLPSPHSFVMGRGRTAADVQALAVLAGFCLFLGGSAFGKVEFPTPRKREPANKSEAPGKTDDVKKTDEEKKP